MRPTKVENHLFAFKKPYRAATPQRLNRWMKDILKESEVDRNILTAHSKRYASTYAAARSGLNIETIRQAAGWRQNSSVLARFYNGPLINQETFSSY